MPELPRAIKCLIKLISRFIQRPWQRPFPQIPFNIVNWNPNEDIKAYFLIFEWMGLINSFYKIVFSHPVSPPLEEFEEGLLEWYGLKENQAWSLILLHAHISSLLSGAKDANQALMMGSISHRNSTYVLSLVECIDTIFSVSECEKSGLMWFMPLEGHESSSSFRATFLNAWKAAVQMPDGLFNGNRSNDRSIITVIDCSNVGGTTFLSIYYLAFSFFSFAYRFFSTYKVPIPLQKEVMRIFCEDIMRRISIYVKPDFLWQLVECLLNLNGVIIAALKIDEWGGREYPISIKSFHLFNDEKIYLCSSRHEDMLSHSIANSFFSIDHLVRHMISFYNPGGRTGLFAQIVPSASEGGLEHSTIWKCWYESYSSIFSSFLLNNETIHYSPKSFAILIATKLTSTIFERPVSQESTMLLTESMIPFFHHNHVSPDSLFHKCINLEYGTSYISWFYEKGRPLERFKIQLNSILGGPEFDEENSINLENFYRRKLISLFKLLPFCIRHISISVEIDAICSWIICHFFEIKSLMSIKRDFIMISGPNEFATFIWKLIFTILQEDQSIRANKDKFFRIICFLYNRYFSKCP